MRRVLRFTCPQRDTLSKVSEAATCQNRVGVYLQHISTGGPTEHVAVVRGHLDALHDPLQLAEVAVCGHNLSSLWAQLPHPQSVAGQIRQRWMTWTLTTTLHACCMLDLLSSCDKEVISSIAEGEGIDRASTLHGGLAATHCLLLLQVPDHHTASSAQASVSSGED